MRFHSMTCFAVSLGAATSAVPSLAHACDYVMDPDPVRAFPSNQWIDDLPANSWFAYDYEPADAPWIDGDGNPVELVRDDDLSALASTGHPWAINVFRPAIPLNEGATYTGPSCSSAAHDCGFVVGVADTAAPDAPVIDSVVVRYVTNGHDGGAAGCPDLDVMNLQLALEDDRTASNELVLIAYVGDDEAAANSADAGYVWMPTEWNDPDPGDGLAFAQVLLGVAKNHERSGEHLRAAGPMCFTLAAMDRAGNVSERSEAVCLDTTDPRDPLVERTRADHGPFGCATGSGSAATPLLILLVGFGLTTTSRRGRERRR